MKTSELLDSLEIAVDNDTRYLRSTKSYEDDFAEEIKKHLLPKYADKSVSVNLIDTNSSGGDWSGEVSIGEHTADFYIDEGILTLNKEMGE